MIKCVSVLARLWPHPEVFSSINVQQALIWPDAGFYGCYNAPLNWTLDSLKHTGENKARMKISFLSLGPVWSGCQAFPADETGQMQSSETLCDLQTKETAFYVIIFLLAQSLFFPLHLAGLEMNQKWLKCPIYLQFKGKNSPVESFYGCYATFSCFIVFFSRLETLTWSVEMTLKINSRRQILQVNKNFSD